MPKRKHEPVVVDAVPEVSNPEAAAATIRSLIKRFDIDLAQFQDDSTEDSTGVKATFSAVAPLVGLNPYLALTDIKTFEIHRSRIPTDLFKSIVMDMDVMLMQYGTLHEHKNEEARSRFFSPVFNHIVKQFTFMLRNDPEIVVAGHISTGGRIKYFFKTFGTVVILCIEMKFKLGNDTERLDAIAQVIAECDGCDLNNHKAGFSLPIHCILSDGLFFEFFKFDKSQASPFLRGCFSGDPAHLRRGLRLPDFTMMESSTPFIVSLRRACETVFDTMMCAYISGLTAYRGQSKAREQKEGSTRPSFDKWDQAVKSAQHALEKFREAESHRQKGALDSADESVNEGICALQKSTGAVPTHYVSPLIMTGWDDAQVRKG